MITHRFSIIRFAWLVIILVVAGLTARADAPARPVVFVPGIVGSVLSDSSGKVVWGDRKSLKKSQFGKMDLLPENGQPVSLEPTDALRKVPLLFGSLGVGVYSDLIDFLTSQTPENTRPDLSEVYGDLVEDETLFVFSYDWRRSSFANAKKLNDFIEEKIPDGEYDIVAHSMGGLVTRIMLSKERPDSPCFDSNSLGLKNVEYQQLCTALFGETDAEWPITDFGTGITVDDRLHRFLEIAVPHRGSVNVVSSFLEGWGGVSQFLLGGKRGIQDVVLSMVTPYELIPTYENCCADGVHGGFPRSVMDDPLDEDMWATKILGFGLEQCPYSGCKLKREVLRQGLLHKKKIDQIVTDGLPKGVKSVGILGRGVKKSKNTFYVAFDAGGDGDKVTFRNTSEGDGTVFRLSAISPEDEDKYVTIMNKSHPFIFSDEFAEEYIYNSFLKPSGDPIEAVAFGGGEEFAGGVVNAIALEPQPQAALVNDEVTAKFYISDIRGKRFDVEQLKAKTLELKFLTWENESEVLSLPMTFNEEASVIEVGANSETEYVFEAAVGRLMTPDVYKLQLMDGETEVAVSFMHIVEP